VFQNVNIVHHGELTLSMFVMSVDVTSDIGAAQPCWAVTVALASVPEI